MHKSFTGKIFWFLALSVAHALAWGSDSLPPVSSFFGPEQVTEAVLSPKGNFVAIASSLPDGSEVVAVRDVNDLKKMTIAIKSLDYRIASIQWVNENRLIFAFYPRRPDAGKTWAEFAADRDGSNLTRLISGDWRREQTETGSHVKSGVLTADYGVYGTLNDGSDDIIVSHRIYNEIDVYPETTRLYRLNTRTHRLTELLEGKQPEHIYSWALDMDRVPQLAMSQFQGRCAIHYRPRGASDWSEISNEPCYESEGFVPAFFDGNGQLYVQASYHGHEALFQYDLKTRKRAAEPFIAIDGFDFSGSPEIDFAARKILGIHVHGDAQSTVWLDPRYKAIQEKVNAILPQTGNILHCGADCARSPAVLVTAASDRQPRQYYVYNVASGAMTALGGPYPAIRPAQMGTRDFYHYAARDGMSIPVYVTVPPGKANGPWPTVVLVHGGPNVRGASWEWEADAQFLASRGYLVLQPEFRGSTGFGFAHFRAGWHQWGQSMQDDLADAASWAIKKGWSDPKRIGIMGASYGGYATLMGLIKNPELFRCGVEWAGATDIALRFKTAEDDATTETLHYSLKTLVGDPVADAAMFAENSPLVQAARLRQPLLMAHGALDMRVPIVHATRFRDAVARQNQQIEWVVYDDDFHGWYHEKNSIDFWTRVEAFLDKHLKHAP